MVLLSDSEKAIRYHDCFKTYILEKTIVAIEKEAQATGELFPEPSSCDSGADRVSCSQSVCQSSTIQMFGQEDIMNLIIIVTMHFRNIYKRHRICKKGHALLFFLILHELLSKHVSMVIRQTGDVVSAVT